MNLGRPNFLSLEFTCQHIVLGVRIYPYIKKCKGFGTGSSFSPQIFAGLTREGAAFLGLLFFTSWKIIVTRLGDSNSILSKMALVFLT